MKVALEWSYTADKILEGRTTGIFNSVRFYIVPGEQMDQYQVSCNKRSIEVETVTGLEKAKERASELMYLYGLREALP